MPDGKEVDFDTVSTGAYVLNTSYWGDNALTSLLADFNFYVI